MSTFISTVLMLLIIGMFAISNLDFEMKVLFGFICMTLNVVIQIKDQGFDNLCLASEKQCKN
jgi:hypothetical protein